MAAAQVGPGVASLQYAGGDPALHVSQLYAAWGAGHQPGTLTQREREAKLRASIPGGDKKELLSELLWPSYPLLCLQVLWTDPRLCQKVPDSCYQRIQLP